MTALNLFSVRLCRRRVMRTQTSGTTLSELSGKWGRGKAPTGNALIAKARNVVRSTESIEASALADGRERAKPRPITNN